MVSAGPLGFNLVQKNALPLRECPGPRPYCLLELAVSGDVLTPPRGLRLATGPRQGLPPGLYPARQTGTALTALAQLLDATETRPVRFAGPAHVRVTAAAHIAAAEKPEAGGQRFLSGSYLVTRLLPIVGGEPSRAEWPASRGSPEVGKRRMVMLSGGVRQKGCLAWSLR